MIFTRNMTHLGTVKVRYNELVEVFGDPLPISFDRCEWRLTFTRAGEQVRIYNRRPHKFYQDIREWDVDGFSSNGILWARCILNTHLRG